MGSFLRIPLWMLLLSMGILKVQNLKTDLDGDVTFTSDLNSNTDFLRMVKTTGVMPNEICSYWNFHYNTFDGDIFYFPGTCNYILSSHCKSTYEDFIIQMQNTMENGFFYTKIIMKIDIMIVELFNDTVLVNGDFTELPYSSSGVMINKIGVYTKVTSKIGLEFNMNDDGSLMLRLDSKYSNQTCGLCGDYNGISKYNEFISSSGYEITETEFGNLKKVNGPNEQCDDVAAPDWESCNETGDVCAFILIGPSFVDCVSVLPPDAYVYSCMQDLCTCKENFSSDCICSTIAEYSRQCIRVGGKPENWRTQELCPKTCPLNLEYSECGPSCRDSCSNPERGSICENRCVDGCFCPSGMVLDDIQYQGCINIDQCACTYNGNVFLPGETHSTSCSSCTCSVGKWNCTDTPCTSTCSIKGGSHITTFDVTHFTVYGDCTYVFSKVCDGGNFTVLAEIRPCGRKDTEVCLMEVIIILNSGQTTIEVRPTGEVYVNFLYTFLPISSGYFTMLQPSPFYIVFDSIDGMQAIIQLVPVMQLYVVLDPIYKTRTCGICGNFNDIQKDDFQTISGVIEGSAAAFVNTWKTEANCPSVKNILDDPCSLSLENEDYAKHWCGFLRDPNNVFSQCHYVVNPNVYYKSCLTDTCSCERSEECMCAALFSYVQACAAKGVILINWNNLVCSKYKSVCSKNLVYSYAISTCLPTCRSLSISDVMCKVEFDPLMGCTCGKGLYLDDDGKCVLPSFCPCYYRGSPIYSGTTINEGGVICTCTKGKLNCIGNEVADCVDPKVYISCQNAKPGTPGAECFKSCETLDMHCYSKRCSPGCVCPDDLVSDDKGGCIKENDCPCIHNEAMYAPGDEIKIRCNTCVCKDRKWNCTKNVCLGTCQVYGDGHYITFDGQLYSFGGECEYTLAKDRCSLNDTGSTFRIITENIPCGTTGTTCSKSIKIFLEGYELILLDDHLNVLQRGNGTGVPYRVRLMGIYLVIETNQGLLLVWDKKTTIYIKVTNIFQGMLCGLCGNYDGNRNNDFTTRTNAVVGSVEEFANSWKLSLACPDAKLNKNSCALNPYRVSWAQKQCSIIQSSIFAACHPHVNPVPYYDNCVSDTCACNTGGDCECFCTSVAAYAQACGEFFICIYWRSPTICPLFCDYYNKEKRCEWHYRPCGAPCLKTCRNPRGTCSYELGGLEGCYPTCPNYAPYFDEDEMECVSQCGCFDEDRKYYKLGSKMPSKETCIACNCTEHGIMCSPNAEACVCIYEGQMYNYNQSIYNTTDGMGGCITATCKENGTIYREIYPCLSAFTSPFTFSTVPTTAATNVTQMTTTLCVVEQCEWSEWFNVSDPATQNGDDDESYENIRGNGYNICENPKDIYCEADNSSTAPLDLTTYNIICNVSIGLLCYQQSSDAPCPNYQIKVLCCSFVPCEYLTSTETTTTETPSTTSNLTTTKVEIMTTKTSARTPISITQRQPFSSVSSTISVFCTPGCRWTQWFNRNSPSSGLSGGEFENLKDLQSACRSPNSIECRATNITVTQLNQPGQTVICNTVDGLVCLNKDQISQICYDYEIRLFCCDDYSNCITTAQPTPETTSKKVTTTFISTHCYCLVNGATFSPGDTVYNETDASGCYYYGYCNTNCKVDRFSGPCLSSIPATSVTTTKTPTTSTKSSTLASTSTPLTSVHTTTTSAPTSTTSSTVTSAKTSTTSVHTSTTPAPASTTYSTVTPAKTSTSTTPLTSVHTTTTSAPTSTTSSTVTPAKTSTSVHTTTTPAPASTTYSTVTPAKTSTTSVTSVHTTSAPTSATSSTVTPAKISTPVTSVHTTTSSAPTSTTSSTVTPAKTSTSTTFVTSVPSSTSPSQTSTIYSTMTSPKISTPSFSVTSIAASSTLQTTTTIQPTVTPVKTSTSITVTKGPTTTSCAYPMFPVTESNLTIEGCPPKKTNEKWNLDNCTVATCHGNNIVTLEQVTCPVAEKVTCATGSKPTVVYSLNGCCYHYECEGVCVLMDNNQYMTFDGTTYEFVNNCTNILVQEINEKYNHFLILAKNDYCSEANSASCPQTIIISFENNIVTLMRSMKNGAMNKQIMFNQKIVSPGFTKDGITISSTGIDIVVNIAALKAHIIFSDTLFMLTLPLSTFLNSTEGLCGTFTNDRSDDCLFPDGTYASDCSQIAPFWNFNNITDPICSQALPLNTTEQTPTITTCIETNLCDIINSSVFAPCHENIPPDTYFQMCLKKACQTHDEINLCSILESYARQCQLQGTCVDWRNSTGNMCAYKCPLEMDYQACGPSQPPTCYPKLPVTSKNDVTEGCFCTAGKILFNHYTNLCVPTCPCIGPDGMPKMPGSSWITGCYDCICEMNSVTVQCQPVQCATPVTPPCTNAGYAVVEVKDPLQPCCSKFECRCNTSLCQNTTTECPLGFQLTVPVYANGECCVINECKPMNVCVENGTIYLPNQVVSSLNPDVCTECTCTSETDPFTMINSVACLSKECLTTCKEGFNYTVKDGECCGTCVQVTCIMTMENETIIIQPGESWHMPGNNCSYHVCEAREDHVILTTVQTPCAVLSQSDCGMGYRYTVVAGDCCGECELLTCIVTLDNNSTHVLQPGEVWSSADNPCVIHECVQKVDTVYLDSKQKLCIINCGPGFLYTEITGECCGECIRVACSLNMDNTTKILQPGETFIPPDNPCIKYICSQADGLVAEKTVCPKFDAADCKEGTINMTADGCCMTCEMQAAQKNCSLYSMSAHIQSGDCNSSEPVDLTYCAGTCSSSFMYSMITNMMETKCTCCVALRSTTKEIMLSCPSGNSIPTSYTYVEECGCSVPTCQDILQNGQNGVSLVTT